MKLFRIVRIVIVIFKVLCFLGGPFVLYNEALSISAYGLPVESVSWSFLLCFLYGFFVLGFLQEYNEWKDSHSENDT